MSQRLRVVEGDNRGLRSQAARGQYNLRILQPAFTYVRARFGEDTLQDMMSGCGLPPTMATRKAAWITHDQFEHLLASLRDLVDSDEEFVRASAYEFKKQYGPLLLVVRCMSVRGILELAARTSHMAVTSGGYTVIDGTRTSVRLRYDTRNPESRLACLSRQAALTTSPTLFLGVPPGKLKEASCVALGDECCEYHLSWQEPLRLRWALAGMAIGAVTAAFLPEGMVEPWLAYALLSTLGGLAGLVAEFNRVLDEHLDFATKTALESQEVVRAHADAMDQLTDLQERERDWNRRLEEGVEMRTRKLNAVIERLQSALRHRSATFPAAGDPADDGTGRARMAAVERAVDRVSRLVGELASIASNDATSQDFHPEVVSVDEFVGQIRRQLKATMMGRNVRITVFQTREAPATITTIRPVLERVVDNLLFNASRSTDRGSVVVEAGGTPGSLLLKLSDTGSGVSKERLEQVFGNEQGPAGPINDRSGLAYAARLLDQIGGRLEIMSEPEVGTTLWVYVPTDYSAVQAPGPATVTTEPDENDGGGTVLPLLSKGAPDAADA